MESTDNTDQPAPGKGARIGLRVILVAVLVHSAAIALWVAPPNILKDRIGFNNLRSYVLPMFDQSWSVFAPEADNGYDLFEIRGTLRGKNGRETQTGWVKVTAKEVGPQLRYHPFPSRTLLITDRLANDQLRLFGQLSPAQQTVVHVSGVSVSTATQNRRLLAAATNDTERQNARSYTWTEDAVEEFLSGIAYGVWGPDTVAVQYRQNQVFVPTYQSSKGDHQVTSGYLFVSNVRPIRHLDADERSAFTSYVRTWGIR